MRYLITQSLLSSWLYTFNCAEGYEDEAMQSFKESLLRIKGETTQAMQNGIDFEDSVYSVACNVPCDQYAAQWDNGIKKVAEVIDGSVSQVKCYKEFSVAGYDFLLYGIIDAIKAGHIYDIKFMNKSMGSTDVYGKYFDSPQHSAYLFATPEADDFTYLLSDGDELYTERYTKEITRPFPDIVAEFIQWLENMEMIEIYKEHWKCEGQD